MSKKRFHICFVAPTAYPVVSGDESVETVGGAQAQQAIIARELVARGHRVSMICMDHGQKDGLEIDGITIFKAYRPNAGLPVVRFLWPRLSTIWQALRRADADVYYYRAAGMLAGVVAAFCQRHGKRSIYAAAGNPDLEPNTSRIRYKRDRLLFEYGLRNVDQIIVQNNYQRGLCEQNYGRSPVLINNCWPTPDGFKDRASSNRILWVSMMRRLKRPQLFLALARALPQYRFTMVGGAKEGGQRFFDLIAQEAAEIPNLEFVGYVPLSRVDWYFDDARLFVNTSESEGFPNTFLQAWARGVPTVSFVDCGARCDGGPVGLTVSSPEEMRQTVDLLMKDEPAWCARSELSLRHFTAHHSPAMVVSRYEEVISRLMGATASET